MLLPICIKIYKASSGETKELQKEKTLLEEEDQDINKNLNDKVEEFADKLLAFEKKQVEIKGRIQNNMELIKKYSYHAITMHSEIIESEIEAIKIPRKTSCIYEEIYLTLNEQEQFFEEEYKKINQEYIDEIIKIGVQTLIDGKHIIAMKNSLIDHFQLINEYIQENIYSSIELIINDFIQECQTYSEKLHTCRQEIKMDHNIIKTGVRGEKEVNEHLDFYRDDIRRFDNIRFEVDGISVESDNLIIAENGIFCLEVKNYGESGGGTIIRTKDGKWKRKTANGKEVPIDNITSQIYRHIGLMQRVINDEMKKIYGKELAYISIYPIIVIANDKIDIDCDDNIPIKRISDIYHTIRTHNPDEKLDRKYWDNLSNIIQKCNKGQKKYKVYKRSEAMIKWLEVLDRKLSAINEVLILYRETLKYIEENDCLDVGFLNLVEMHCRDIHDYYSIENNRDINDSKNEFDKMLIELSIINPIRIMSIQKNIEYNVILNLIKNILEIDNIYQINIHKTYVLNQALIIILNEILDAKEHSNKLIVPLYRNSGYEIWKYDF